MRSSSFATSAAFSARGSGAGLRGAGSSSAGLACMRPCSTSVRKNWRSAASLRASVVAAMRSLDSTAAKRRSAR
jgi:hypothetical protein